MANLELDTTTAEYRALLTAQREIEVKIRPPLRIVMLLMDQGKHDQARRLIGRDPLLRREIRKGRKFQDFASEDL